MLRAPIAALALIIAAPSVAQEPEWRTAEEYDVLLEPFGYEPQLIRLEAGKPVKLRFVNQGQGTYSFSAREFFRASQVHAGDADVVVRGALRLSPGERRTIALVPAPGRYHVRSTNVFHRVLGMTGQIIVE